MKVKALLLLKRSRLFTALFLVVLSLNAGAMVTGCAPRSQMADRKEITANDSQMIAPVELPVGAATSGAIPADDQTRIEKRWGVKILPVRLNASTYLVDFRYKITDPEKALPLQDRNIKPYLIEETSGEKCYVPSDPKLGSLRAKGKQIAERVYFILFGNSAGTVKKGSKVTIVIGDFKVENLVVE